MSEKGKPLKEDSLRDLWFNIKSSNICIIGETEGKDREKKARNIFDNHMAINFLNLKKETDIQVQGAWRVHRDESKMQPPPNIDHNWNCKIWRESFIGNKRKIRIT